MNSHLSTRSLLIALAVLILAACAYFLFSIRSGGAGVAGNGAPPLTVEEKAAILNSLSQSSAGTSGAPAVTAAEAAMRLQIVESVAQSSADSPASKQSDTEKLKILNSI